MIFLLHEAKSKLFANTVDFLVLGFSPDADGKKKKNAVARTNKCECMSSKVSILKSRPGFRHEASMQQLDDTVDAGTNTDLLPVFFLFFKQQFAALRFFSPTD